MKKKGFTLIELLAVIVILAIIALIAVPVIMNIISSARKSAFEDTAYGLISAGEMYYASALLNDGMSGDTEFTIENGEFTGENKLDVKGSLPGSGKIKVSKNGKVALAITNGSICIKKGYDDSDIETLEEFETCDLPTGAPAPGTLAYLVKTNAFATSVDACATTGTCAPGTEFAIEVAPGDIKNFYVISDVNNEVTLIMDRNIGETVAWNTSGNSSDGPVTALNYLESQTSGWTNIEEKDYTLNNFSLTRTNAKARMLTETEAITLGCNSNDDSCPDWVNVNLIGPPFGYWLSSTCSVCSSDAYVVHLAGFVEYYIIKNSNFGVRPVITISK